MRLFFFYLSHELVWVYEIELFLMVKNNGNPNMMCENEVAHPGFKLFCLSSRSRVLVVVYHNSNTPCYSVKYQTINGGCSG